MTKLHYLIMRNRKRLPFEDLPEVERRIFLAHGRGRLFRATSHNCTHRWIDAPVTRIPTVVRPFAPNLVYSVHHTSRPASLPTSEDPDPPLVNRITGERIADR